MTSPVRRPVGTAEAKAAMAVKCPHCGAQPRNRCTTPSGRHTLPDPHPARIAAAPAAATIPLPRPAA
ncbi:zinc finger domain-containing protein [Streptacidiphilus cavernicola]|uniref:DNA-binding phage zinc finger domain-containing protein n=1 Tax=Streptacidiphilus cavernicola TaxID=3342716 RepID=A0ABV6W463_9ACTN